MSQLSSPILLRQQKPEAAHPSHQKADSVHHGSSIERLPAELQLQVIENLPTGDLRSIFKLALTGPTFHDLIFKHEASLAENVVVSAVGEDVMRIAATVYELEELGDKLPRTTSSTNSFPDEQSWRLMEDILDRHRGRDSRNWHTQSRITKFSMAASYLKLDVAVEYWAKKLANRALKKAYTIVPRQRWREDPESKPGPNPKPTAMEMRRFRKALYLWHLLSVAFQWKTLSDAIRPILPEYLYGLYRYWMDLTTWEYEQLRQVEILLACSQVGNRFLFPVEHFPAAYAFHIGHGLIRLRVVDALMPWLDRKPTRGNQLGLGDIYAPRQVPAISFRTVSRGRRRPEVLVYCSLMLGYVFWDFERLRKMTREECPSIDDLLEVSRGVVVGFDHYMYICDDRAGTLPASDIDCDCMI
ncbi:hypothetical protein EV127DRAFT_472772, partial [Xylaria flabelliformis]